MVTVICLTVLVVVYGAFSQRLSNTVITGPMVFTAVGLLFGAGGLGVLDLDLDSQGGAEAVTILAEVTLVLVLFTDAARINLMKLRQDANLPLRMLGSLPLVILLGAAVAMVVLPGMDLFAAAVLASVLAPTDAALGQAVVTDARLPVRIRQTLNVESGLNDGIVLPFVTIFLGLAGASEGVESVGGALSFVGSQLGFGLLVGLGVGCVGAIVIDQASLAGWMAAGWQQLAALSVALMCYFTATQVGGNGFIAAFVGGLAFGAFANKRCEGIYKFAEQEGSLLTLLVFAILGASLAPALLQTLDIQTALYVVLSLTVVRMLPIALSLVGAGLRVSSVGFLGWFGPRGLATIVFGLLVVEEVELAEGDRILSIALWTVLASILAHGLSALPLVARYSASLDNAPEKSMAEMEESAEFPTRVSRAMG